MSSMQDRALVRSYLSLRRSIGVLGIALPIALGVLGAVLFGTPLQTSVSAYYHTPVGDIFVGTLCAIGVFLWSYCGYTKCDRDAAMLAALCAFGTALFPTEPAAPSRVEVIIGWLHVGFAGGLFALLAYFSLALFRLSDKSMPTVAKFRRNRVYQISGHVIVMCLVAIAAVKLPAIEAVTEQYYPVFYLEAVAIIAFGIAWLTKGAGVPFINDDEPEPEIAQVHPRIPRRDAPRVVMPQPS